MMFPRFRRKSRGPDTISTLYGMIVAQARLPIFYRDYAVADTVNGRFDLIVLHLAMVLDRLFQEPALQALGQGVFDHFCRDMDHNLREMGIGDLKVPKEMRRIGEAFYGRSQAYRTAWAGSDEQPLVQALERNIYEGQNGGARRLAAYVRAALSDLAGQPAAAFENAILHFPKPDAILPKSAPRD